MEGKCLFSIVMVLLLAGTANSQLDHHQSYCSNPVPGLEKMTHGIDITTFDLLSTSNEGLKYPVIEFKCEQGRVETVDGINYDLPDQIMSVTELPGGIANNENKLVTSYSEARRVIAANLGVSANLFGKFGFSSSISLQSMQNTIANQSMFVSVVSAYESARKAFMVPSRRLHPSSDLQHTVDHDLASDFDPVGNPTSAETYRDLIRNFGTHFFTSANFGGMVMVETHTQTDYLLSHSELEVNAQAEASFFSIVSFSRGIRYQTVNVDSQYTQMSSQTTRYLGGSANLLQTPGGLEAWQPTVNLAPWLFKGRLEPITRLIRDSRKRRALERATEDYTLRASLDEMSRLLSTRQASWSSALRQQVNALKTNPLLTVSLVQPLMDEILLRGPQWLGNNGQAWTKYQNKFYTVVTERLTWTAAKERCEEMNSHLVIIENDLENTFVYNLARGKVQSVWIGLKDRGSLTAQTWVNGQPLSNYNAWAWRQPDQPGGCSNLMLDSTPYYWTSWRGSVKEWDDLPCDNTVDSHQLPSVCESSVIMADWCGDDWHVFQGACYKLHNVALSWEDAKSTCLSLGAKLVWITSASENAFVKSMFAGIREIWMGLTRAGTGWVWTNGQRATYTNWQPNEPNNSHGNENCGNMCTYGKWNDNNCATLLSFVCKK